MACVCCAWVSMEVGEKFANGLGEGVNCLCVKKLCCRIWLRTGESGLKELDHSFIHEYYHEESVVGTK